MPLSSFAKKANCKNKKLKNNKDFRPNRSSSKTFQSWNTLHKVSLRFFFGAVIRRDTQDAFGCAESSRNVTAVLKITPFPVHILLPCSPFHSQPHFLSYVFAYQS